MEALKGQSSKCMYKLFATKLKQQNIATCDSREHCETFLRTREHALSTFKRTSLLNYKDQRNKYEYF